MATRIERVKYRRTSRNELAPDGSQQKIQSPDRMLYLVASDPVPRESEDLFLRTCNLADRYKRAFDIAASVLLIVFFLPLMLFVAVLIFATGPGGVLFRQERIGRDGQVFLCLKFRTMEHSAESALEHLIEASSTANTQWASVQKIQNDPRVIPLGRVLRKYSIDELPQLFNVLFGEMSIVGPRPIVASEIKRFEIRFADYCMVRPGLTGLWQVSGRNRTTYEERVKLDSLYARTRTVRGDLAILLRTIPEVLMGRGY